MAISPPTTFSLEHVLHAEHARLVRLCAYLTNDHDAADDLAQETLIEAWRQQHKLVDPDGASAWLNAIARNVCLRWARRRGRELARTEPLPDEASAPDPFEFEVELERDELATLLDRALALLPPDTRDVLIQTYIHESPHAEIAERLGLSANAVGVRVHRGKLALRRILINQFPDDAAAYGLIAPQCCGWQETRIWCPICGERRLEARFDQMRGLFSLRCTTCPTPGLRMYDSTSPALVGGARRLKTALAQDMAREEQFWRQGTACWTVICPKCGQPAPVRSGAPAWSCAPLPPARGLHVICPRCENGWSISLRMFANILPQVRRFWRHHPRMWTQGQQEIEADGVPAIVTSFRDKRSSAGVDVIVVRDTFELIDVYVQGVPQADNDEEAA